jgi:type II secretory ATPase GspE/PulE/Tfp pilus assembly ATPase PilB-like protein
MDNELPALTIFPSSLSHVVAMDASTGRIHVEKRLSGDPVLLTWLDRNRRNGHQLTLIPTEVDEISRLRNTGLRLEKHLDITLEVKNEAIAMIRTASQYGASDLHLMMRGTHTEIQVVVDGRLFTLRKLSQKEGESLALAIYQGLATTKDASFNPLEFQNAQISGEDLPVDVAVTSLRIVRGPCYPQAKNGSFMTLRLQYARHHRQSDMPALPYPKGPEGELQLRHMGYSTQQVEKLKLLMDTPSGLVVFTGPTGSGKTTAMHEALQELARAKPYRRLVTAEDPVEYPMDWAVQIPITNAKTNTETAAAFAATARVMLRMAPNAIQLGELRDAEVAVTALEMAVTGHQVWTTLHVDDPYLIVERLEFMDAIKLNRRIFCDHKIVRGVVAQRLLPKLCPHCSVPIGGRYSHVSERMLAALRSWGDVSNVRVQSTHGCQFCGGRGTAGRFAVAEVVVACASLMADFIEHGSEIARRNHRNLPDSDASMLETAIQYALKGVVDPRSIEDKIDLIKVRDDQ